MNASFSLGSIAGEHVLLTLRGPLLSVAIVVAIAVIVFELRGMLGGGDKDGEQTQGEGTAGERLAALAGARDQNTPAGAAAPAEEPLYRHAASGGVANSPSMAPRVGAVTSLRGSLVPAPSAAPVAPARGELRRRAPSPAGEAPDAEGAKASTGATAPAVASEPANGEHAGSAPEVNGAPVPEASAPAYGADPVTAAPSGRVPVRARRAWHADRAARVILGGAAVVLFVDWALLRSGGARRRRG